MVNKGKGLALVATALGLMTLLGVVVALGAAEGAPAVQAGAERAAAGTVTETLMALYYSTGGVNWADNSGWGSSAPYCTPWYGVGCDERGEVTGLSLYGNNLSGPIPAELTQLGTLTDLDLQGNPYLTCWETEDALRWATEDSTPDYQGPTAVCFYVNREATGGANTGTSWADAFTELQPALAVTLTVPGATAEIWVAEGAYYPDYDLDLEVHTGWVTATFALTDGVALYGGFDPEGGVITPDQRDPAAYVTVLSGDLDRNDTADAHRVVTTTENINGDNAWTVVTASGVTETAVLDGFIVTAGNADGTIADCAYHEPCRSGGGMYNYQSSSTLADVTFSGNSTGGAGGGMYNHRSSPTLTNVRFNGNSAGAAGGGMINLIDSDATLVNVTFSGNWAGESGGGMFNGGSNPTLTQVTFSDNSAGERGGGMYNGASSPTLTGVTFTGNSASFYGGGIYSDGRSPTLVNVTFSGNWADWGGGMVNWVDSHPMLVNVTFSGNWAAYDGGGMYNADSSPTLANGILWGNTDGGTDEQEAQIFNVSSVVTVTYSLVGGGVYTGTGNISADPLFVVDPDPGGDGEWGTPDDDYGDLRLGSSSLAIDVGSNAAVPEGVITDLAGWPRIINDRVDMGAYETPLTVYLPVVLRAAP